MAEKVKIPFGKYKDKTLDWLYKKDRQYFNWLSTIELKPPFAEEYEIFRLDLNHKEARLVANLLRKVNDYVENDGKVYKRYVCGVGLEYFIYDVYTREVAGNQYSICGEPIVDKDNFDKLHNTLARINKEQGEPVKE